MSLVQEAKKRPFVEEVGVDLSTLSLSEDRPWIKKSRSSLDSIGDDALMALDLATPSSTLDATPSELTLAEDAPPRIPAFLLDPSPDP